MALRNLPLLFVPFLLAVGARPCDNAMRLPETQSAKEKITIGCGGPFRIAKISQINNANATVYVNAREGKLEDVTKQVYTVCEADQILMTQGELTRQVDDAEGRFHKDFTKRLSSQLVSKKLTLEQIRMAKDKLQDAAAKDTEAEIHNLANLTSNLLKQLPTSQ